VGILYSEKKELPKVKDICMEEEVGRVFIYTKSGEQRASSNVEVSMKRIIPLPHITRSSG
jgi:hypothetical protein